MKIDKLKTASFDVDSQNTFTPLCPDELPVPEGDKIAPELNAQAKFAKYRLGSKEGHSPKAIWVADEDHPQYSPVEGTNVDIRWVPHAMPGTFGFESIAGLPHPSEYDFFVWKGVELDMHPYGSCFHDLAENLSTGVIEFLQAHQIDTIILGGLATDYCVKNTVIQLLKSNFKVIVNLGACRGINQETTLQAIETMRKQGAIFINSSVELEIL
jgi:nicotinamidase/pyrazinamidase